MIKKEPIGCRGGCGKKAADETEAMHLGWSFLEISRGWRCGACLRELQQADKQAKS